MRIRLQYILFVLLLVAAGMLCRVQKTHQVHSVRNNTETLLPQTLRADNTVCAGLVFACPVAAENAASGRFLAHTFFAPELSGCSVAQNNDSKVMARVVSLFGHGVPACPAVAGDTDTRPAGEGSRGVDYYIYTLGEIRI